MNDAPETSPHNHTNGEFFTAKGRLLLQEVFAQKEITPDSFAVIAVDHGTTNFDEVVDVLGVERITRWGELIHLALKKNKEPLALSIYGHGAPKLSLPQHHDLAQGAIRHAAYGLLERIIETAKFDDARWHELMMFGLLTAKPEDQGQIEKHWQRRPLDSWHVASELRDLLARHKPAPAVAPAAKAAE